MMGWQLSTLVFGIVALWALLSWATVPSAYQQEHELRLASQTQVAVEATRIVVLEQQVPTRAPYPYPYPGYRP